MTNSRIYITTSIPYINAPLHIGHSLEFIEADFFVRLNKLLGKEVYFTSGTDENSLKVAKEAEKLKVEVKKFAEEQSKKVKELLNFLEIKIDHFQRTSALNHKSAVKEVFKRIRKDVYKKTYRGFYCPECEAFLKKEELENGFCPVHKIKVEKIEEENYFFPLRKYKNELIKIYKRGEIEIVPKKRLSEILSWLDDLEDISISRSKIRARNWGIELPIDKNQIFYVWFDALINYLSNLGFPKKTKEYSNFWLSEKAEKIHFIGKDILRFHSILWPSILLAADLPLPSKIFVHGFLLNEGEKMSKSRGNIVDPFLLGKECKPDVIRYFLLREFSPTEDGDFSLERLKIRYNNDLANGLGNLVSRINSLFIKEGKIKVEDDEIRKKRKEFEKKFIDLSEKFLFNKAVDQIWLLISEVDRYINKKEPWRPKKDKEKIFSTLFVSLAEIAFYLKPIMPKISEKICISLGISFKKSRVKKGVYKIKKIEKLFPRK